jgi:hypothetical protein
MIVIELIPNFVAPGDTILLSPCSILNSIGAIAGQGTVWGAWTVSDAWAISDAGTIGGAWTLADARPFGNTATWTFCGQRSWTGTGIAQEFRSCTTSDSSGNSTGQVTGT